MRILISPASGGGFSKIQDEAISVTYNMNGFTPMNSVLLSLNFDRAHFASCAHLHAGDEFRVFSHRDKVPLIITTTKTLRWDSEPRAAERILAAAHADRCRSLRMIHFRFVKNQFPRLAFEQCLRSLNSSKYRFCIDTVTIDVDDRYLAEARYIANSHACVESSVLGGKN